MALHDRDLLGALLPMFTVSSAVDDTITSSKDDKSLIFIEESFKWQNFSQL